MHIELTPNVVGVILRLKGSFELENRMPVLWEIFLRNVMTYRISLPTSLAQVSLTAVERGAKREREQ